MKKIFLLCALGLVGLAPQPASAHCDTMDGPVVKAAQLALQSGKLEPVLAWVRAEDEAEIRSAFDATLVVRGLSPKALELADRYFFETLVRVHRAGEGAPYTGLKPAGSTTDPALIAADRALETGQVEPLAELLAERVKAGLAERFARLRALQEPGEDVAKGRAWVEAYVDYIHYVAGVHRAALGVAGEHGEGGGEHEHREQ
jgi:hypothetical protein